jgi:hypothetical protein
MTTKDSTQCISYCTRNTYYSLSTEHVTVFQYGNSTSVTPTADSSRHVLGNLKQSLLTIPPQPCPTKNDESAFGTPKLILPGIFKVITTTSYITSKISVTEISQTNTAKFSPHGVIKTAAPAGVVTSEQEGTPSGSKSQLPTTPATEGVHFSVPGTDSPTAVVAKGEPTPTVVGGISLMLGSSVAIIAYSTYIYGPGATERTTVIEGQTISVGAGGIGFAATTIQPASIPTRVINAGGVVVTAMGSSEAIVGGTTFTYGPDSTPRTETINGQIISIGPQGIGLSSTTIGGPQNPMTTQVATQGVIQISEIGTTQVVIEGVTYTAGPGAKPTTIVVSGQTVSIGSGGVAVDGSTVFAIGSPMTAGRIILIEVGSTLVVMRGSTNTIDPNATPMTDVFDSQTTSTRPNGLGFQSTAVRSFGAAPTPVAASLAGDRCSINFVSNRRILALAFEICIIFGIPYLM